MDSAEGEAFLVLDCDLVRRLLLLNVLANNRNRCTPTTCGKVAGRPQHIAPQFFLDTWMILFAEQAA